MRGELGAADRKAKFGQMFSNNRAVNLLAAARVFLFASRDVWFVVGLPVFLRTRARLELLAGRRLPRGLGHRLRHRAGLGAALRAARRRRASPTDAPPTWLAFALAAFPAGIAIALGADVDPTRRGRRRPDRLRRRLRAELGGALVPDPRLRRRRQGRDERRLLLHGQRRRPARRAPCSPALLYQWQGSRRACGRRSRSCSRRLRSSLLLPTGQPHARTFAHARPSA